MEFKIRDCSIEQFVTAIKQIELSTKPFDFQLYNEGKQKGNYSWIDLDWNVQRNGKPIFELKLKTEDEKDLDKIPLGNYYIDFYYYSKAGRKIVGSVDLCWNKNNFLTNGGTEPLYLFQSTTEMLMAKGEKYLELRTLKNVMMLGVIDRLKQICSKKGALPDPSLLVSTIEYTFKFSEIVLPKKKNAMKKIDNRVIVVNKAKNDSGSWSFNWIANSKGTFSDCLNSHESIDLDAFERIDDYYSLILGEASEEGGNKGSLVFLNENLQKLRFNKDRIYTSHYEDTCYGSFDLINKSSTYSIFVQKEKVFARIKSFITSDGCTAQNVSETKLTEDEKIAFYRHKVYMAPRSSSLHKTSESVFNVLVAFASTSKEAEDMNIEKFDDANKNSYSRLLHGIDCHLPIGPEISNVLVRAARTISEPITVKHLSYAFKDTLKALKEEGNQTIPADMVIGYKVTCQDENCRSIMMPIERLGLLEDGSYSYKEVQAEKGMREWHCNVCGSYVKTEAKEIKITDRYQNAQELNISNVHVNKVDTEINIIGEIVTPINISRSISVEGVKGLTIPMEKDFLGYVSGEYYNPVTKKMQNLDYLSVDMICPLGALKSKMSGVGVSHLRMLNAFTGSKICIDEMIQKQGDTFEVNDILKECKKVQLHRRVYDSATASFVFKTENVYIGIVSLDVTEVGDEFLKVKTEVDPMKVSFMNNLYYNWLGFDSLNKAMTKASLSNFEEESNKDFSLELLKMFYSDPTGLPEVVKTNEVNDFDNKDGMLTLSSWIKKEEWANALLNHPMLKEDGKFVNGAYYKDNSGNIIVFPSRKTIIKLVDLVNGDGVRLHGIVKNALGIFLDIFIRGYTYKREMYKEQIYSKLTGKQGVLAKSSTFINLGAQGKEVGCGYLPTGVAVIGDPKFWNMAKHKMADIGLSYSAVMSGKQKFYGTSQRDPYIWLFQALNSVELWSVKRANIYFKETYGTSFTEMYNDFNGIMLNVLDMLYLYQTDADGDLRRVLVPFDCSAQLELKILNEKMKNYDLICKSKPSSIIGIIYSKVKNWHLNYVLDEAKTSAKELVDKMSIKIQMYVPSEKNKSIIKNIRSKRNIGMITTSQWKIQIIADYFYRNQKPLIVNGEEYFLTENDRNLISVFYQTVFTQEGCVRALKGKKDLGKCSIDEIAYNNEITWGDEKGNIIKGTVRDMVHAEAINFGHADITDKMFALCEWWKFAAAVTKKRDGTVQSNPEAMIPEAEMLNAYVSLSNGSKYIALDKFEMFERLVFSGSEKMYERNLFKTIGTYLSDRFNKEEK